MRWGRGAVFSMNLANDQTGECAPIGLAAESVHTFSWLSQVVGVLWQVQPRVTGLVIGATVLARFTSLAAFLLPLKVLLLAGSDGGSRYFRMMANPDRKLFWIIALSIAAVTFFWITRVLRAFSEKVSEAGSQEIMQRANHLSLFGNQASIARRHFREITDLCANVIFLIIAFAALTLINPLLVLCLALLFAIQYRLTAFTLAQCPSKLAIRIKEKPGDYLKDLQTLNFWSAFLLILVPFLTGAGGNILLAILAFVLVRQALATLVRAIEAIVDLAGEKPLIDALAFPTHRWQRNYSRAQKFHSLFENLVHLQKIESVLAGHFKDARPIGLHWKDHPLGGISTFVLTFRASPDGLYYQEQVFAPYQAHLVKNEEILFTHISREVLGAPVIRQSFSHGPYHCRLCDYGLGKPPSPAVWSNRFPELLERLWSIEPPETLKRAFSTSHLLLHERLTPEFVRGLALAVSNDNELSTLRAFEAVLPAIRDAISAMPLHVFNPDMFRSNAVMQSDGGVSVMLWGRWRLEPIGAYLPLRVHNDKLLGMLARVRERRSNVSKMLSPDHLQLAAECRQLVNRVSEARYEAALRALPAILNNSAIASAERRDPQFRMAGDRAGDRGMLDGQSSLEARLL
jgi:hypothetical protein